MILELTEQQQSTITWLTYLVLGVILFVVVVGLFIVLLGFFVYFVMKGKSVAAQAISGSIDLCLIASITRLVWFFFGGRSPWLGKAGSPDKN